MTLHLIQNISAMCKFLSVTVPASKLCSLECEMEWMEELIRFKSWSTSDTSEMHCCQSIPLLTVRSMHASICSLIILYCIFNFQTGLGGQEYLSGGTPLYKIKKRFPLGYGRRYLKKMPVKPFSYYLLVNPRWDRFLVNPDYT